MSLAYNVRVVIPIYVRKMIHFVFKPDFVIKEPSETKSTTEKNLTLLFALPYRYVFAIATEDSVFLYDTQHVVPFAYATGIHYSHLSDLSWSSNGRTLIVTSIDGFVTFVCFGAEELGIAYKEPEPPVIPSVQPSSSEQNTVSAQQPTITQLLVAAN